MTLTHLSETARLAGLPSDALLAQFAATHGALISHWSINAFNMMEVRINNWARSRARVERGHEAAAWRRLTLTAMPRETVAVHTIDGQQRWGARYTTLYQRVALELEDLAIRRPASNAAPFATVLSCQSEKVKEHAQQASGT